MIGHGIDVCACGAVIAQCRCMDCGAKRRVVATACSSCASAKATKTATRSVGVSGELVRLRHALTRLQAHTHALEIAFAEAETDRVPPGADAAQALMSTALEIATGLAKVDALIRAQSSEVE